MARMINFQRQSFLRVSRLGLLTEKAVVDTSTQTLDSVPNRRAGGDGGITPLLQVEHTRPAAPQHER